MTKYVKITNLEADGSYIQPMDQVLQAVDGEIDDLNQPVTLRFEAVEMTDDEFNALPEFSGY